MFQQVFLHLGHHFTTSGRNNMRFFPILLLSLTLLANNRTHGQTNTSTPNIVPNPGFERLSAPPIGWDGRSAAITTQAKVDGASAFAIETLCP